MRKFLVVGCGGSGGSTQQFLMDQLRADLSQRGVTQLPQGWQFVHIDVPIAPDGVGRGMPPTVPAQGGRYVGLAPAQAAYPAVAQAVETRLQNVGQLDQLATWRADPASVAVPVADGAGQQRAIGRVLTLAKAQHILDELSAAYAALRANAVEGELAAVANRFSPATRGSVRNNPVVMVVSSMAGGAGASMVLDVCRILTQVEGYDPRSTALFLFTPEVFASLPKGARTGIDGNAMAMMGELLATQAGAGTAADTAVLKAMGLAASESTTPPFGRVIPVGAKIGASGAPFGDGSALGVYRGLGRGLAALMLSGEATNELVAFEITNDPAAIPAKREAFAWGKDSRNLLWGSFGFASLGLGRERYAEYAAQRIAREAVNRLVDGHLHAGDARPATDQLRSLADAKWPDFCRRLGLPVSREEVRSWFPSLLAAAPLESKADEILRETVGRRLQLPQPVELRSWLPTFLQQAALDGPVMRERVGAVAYAWAFDWHLLLLERVETELGRTIVDSGLAAGREMLVRIRHACESWIQELRGAASGEPADVSILPPDTVHRLTGIKGMVQGGHASLELLRNGFTQNLLTAARCRCAAYAADVLSSLRSDLLEPLARSCDDALSQLIVERAATPSDTGLARLRTDDYASWPDPGSQIPRRFFEAHNEVLLTAVESFVEEFRAHVSASEPGRPSADGLRAIVNQVIEGRWQTAGAARDERIVERVGTWRPGCLPTDPHETGAPPSPQRPGQYKLALRPGQILDRARGWVQRPGEPFDAFISQSLRDYLTGTDVGQAEHTARAQQLQQHFREVLELARPLVAVNDTTVAAIHGDNARVVYKFSDVPFAGLPLGDQLVEDLQQMAAGVDPTSVGRLGKVMRPDSRTTRIDVFGSYGSLSPITFSSLLGPLDSRWAAAAGSADDRKSFWRLRRARRLPGCLPMGDTQRRAIIGGWYVARLTGQLRLPGEHPGQGVEVWEEARRRWVSFPDPLLVDKDEFRVGPDVLCSVLLSSMVAMAQSHQYAALDPLLPYTLLRKLWDDTVDGRDEDAPVTMLAAAEPLRQWLRTGDRPPGAPPHKQGAPALPDDPAERKDQLVIELERLRDHVGKQYLAPGQLGASGGGDYSQLTIADLLSRVPLYHEVAGDVYTVLGRLVDLVGQLRLDQTEVTYEFDPALG